MKKKILGGLAVLAIAATAGWNVNFNSQTKWMSDVMLANVEALAQESDSDACKMNISYTSCEKTNLWEYCPCGCFDW